MNDSLPEETVSPFNASTLYPYQTGKWSPAQFLGKGTELETMNLDYLTLYPENSNRTIHWSIWQTENDTHYPYVFSITDFLRPNWTSEGLNLSLHTPAMGRFLLYDGEGMNYSRYIPALGEFASEAWQPPETNLSQYTPAIQEFLQPEYRPQPPDTAQYPAWMIEFLMD